MLAVFIIQAILVYILIAKSHFPKIINISALREYIFTAAMYSLKYIVR